MSSREVIEAHLRRIEAVNPKLNAVTVVLGEQALEAADAADRAVAAGGVLPPLHGVPFTVKENIDLVGTPTTVGLKALAEAYPHRDAPVVERMRAAGAIPIAARTAPAWRSAGIQTTSCTARPATPGTALGHRARPAAARRQPSPPA